MLLPTPALAPTLSEGGTRGSPSRSTASATSSLCSEAMPAPVQGDPTGCGPSMRETWATPMAAARTVHVCMARSLPDSIAGTTRQAKAAGRLALGRAPGLGGAIYRSCNAGGGCLRSRKVMRFVSNKQLVGRVHGQRSTSRGWLVDVIRS